MKIFLSHISEESQLAQEIKQNLEEALPTVKIFVSAVDVHLGDAWLKEIDKALSDSRAVLVLCSQNSTRRPWINFESGGGWSRRLPVIPICHGDLKKEKLPYPLNIFQGIDLDNERNCEELTNRIAGIVKKKVSDKFDFKKMAERLKVKPPKRGNEIGIVLTHGQAKWETTGKSLFKLPGSLPPGVEEDWKFHTITKTKDLLSAELSNLPGLILGSPWRQQMEQEVISAIVEWVKSGGRLLMLGFELGDRHHGGNLGELSRHFGIHPSADIVGPPNYGPNKPYEEAVDFQVADGDTHAFTKDLSSIRLTNVQTVRVEPGGIEWLRVGENVVYRPTRMSVEYRQGTLTQPRETAFDLNKKANWLPVAVEAPQGLCGSGTVHMIGTWDLLGRNRALESENLTLFRRIMNWLSVQWEEC